MKAKIIALSAFLLLGAASLWGQWNNTGTLTINGNMPVITQVSVVDLGVSLALETAATDVLLAQILERSNSATGYTVSVVSTNSGALVGTSLGENLAYTLTIGGAAVDLSAGAVLISDSTLRTVAVGISKEIRLSHGSGGTGALLLAEDSYSDVLTFEIAPK